MRGPRWIWAIVAGTILVAVVAQAQAPSRFGAWNPWLQLAPGDSNEALSRTEQLIDLATAFTLERKLDPRSKALVDEVQTKLGEQDTDELFDLLSNRASDRRARVRLFGRWEPPEYRLTVVAKPSALSQFGDLETELELQPMNAERSSFLFTNHARAHLGALSYSEAVGFWKAGLDWLSRSAAEQRPTAPVGMDDSDRAIIARLFAAYPASTQLFLRYIEVDDAIAPTRSGSWRTRFRARLDRAAIREEYPTLAEKLDQMRGMLDIRSRIEDGKGRTLAILRLESRSMSLAIDFGPEVRSLFDADYEMRTDIRANALGLQVEIQDLRVSTSVLISDEHAELSSRFDRVPKVSVEGAALGIVPVAVIDALIPSSIEGIIRDFFRTLARGNHGRGLRSTTRVPRGGGAVMSAETELELRNNGFIRFAAQMAAERLEMNRRADRQERAFYRRAFEAFHSDFQRFQGVMSTDVSDRRRP